MVNYVCAPFAILEFMDDLITKSGLPVRKVVEHVLIHWFQSFETFACTTHEAITRKTTNSTAVISTLTTKEKFVRTERLPMG